MPHLRIRIIRVYRAHTGAASSRGALSWFARRAQVQPLTVTRWLNGQRRLKGSALALLETLEAQTSSAAKTKR